MNELLKKCNLCPRKCSTDRFVRKGFCGAGAVLRAARAGLHYFEEPFLSGTKGSGTVFFSGCNLRCIYCQNASISGDDSFGIEINADDLAKIFLNLQNMGANNINLVTGTPYIPHIAKALESVRKNRELEIPVIWNSSGYEEKESLKMLEGLVDIWLPDFKTMSPKLSVRYMNASDYTQKAMEALDWMVSVANDAEFFFPDFSEEELSKEDADDHYSPSDIAASGLMKRGVCVRHLVIPGQIGDSKDVLDYLYGTYKDRIWISIMSQYTPMRSDFSAKELNRTLTEKEYDEVVDHAIELGAENCMIQGMGAASESFIPVFDGTGIRI